jgi:hypothetical protein
MRSRWSKLFEEELNQEADQVVLTMTSGSCADYAAYSKEVGKWEAYRRVLDILEKIDDRVAKGD